MPADAFPSSLDKYFKIYNVNFDDNDLDDYEDFDDHEDHVFQSA